MDSLVVYVLKLLKKKKNTLNCLEKIISVRGFFFKLITLRILFLFKSDVFIEKLKKFNIPSMYYIYICIKQNFF